MTVRRCCRAGGGEKGLALGAWGDPASATGPSGHPRDPLSSPHPRPAFLRALSTPQATCPRMPRWPECPGQPVGSAPGLSGPHLGQGPSASWLGFSTSPLPCSPGWPGPRPRLQHGGLGPCSLACLYPHHCHSQREVLPPTLLPPTNPAAWQQR